MKDGHYICNIYLGNSLVELRGYNQEIEYAYIGDENITEMLNELNAWTHVTDCAYAERPWA